MCRSLLKHVPFIVGPKSARLKRVETLVLSARRRRPPKLVCRFLSFFGALQIIIIVAETVSLWVGGLPWAADKDSLKQFLEELGHGDIVDCYVAFDKESGKSRGFGYAYCSAETAAAIAAKTDVEMNGRTLRFDVDASKGKKPEGGDRRQSFGDRPKSAPGTSLICRNLSYNVDNEVLQNHFESSTGARVITNPEDGSSKGLACFYQFIRDLFLILKF